MYLTLRSNHSAPHFVSGLWGETVILTKTRLQSALIYTKTHFEILCLESQNLCLLDYSFRGIFQFQISRQGNTHFFPDNHFIVYNSSICTALKNGFYKSPKSKWSRSDVLCLNGKYIQWIGGQGRNHQDKAYASDDFCVYGV